MHKLDAPRTQRKVILALLMVASLLMIASLPAGLTPQASAQTTWTQIWSDEFNGTANTGVNGANWLYDLGTSYPGGAANWGTGEIETMTNSTANVYQDGAGHLAIKPIRDAGGAWTSGRIETQRNDFQPPAGGMLAVEASIQQPNVHTTNGLGYWPAFWMLGGAFRGNYTNWPTVGEMDILENINGRSSVFSTLHCGPSIPGTCNETTGIGSGEKPCVGCLTSYHTYRLEWDMSVSPQQLRWYLDGNNYFTLLQNQVDAASWTAATNHGYMVILNVAMGGGFPGAFGGGPTAATVSGVPMLVDYVRVYQRGGSAATPTRTATPIGATPTRTATPIGPSPTRTPTPNTVYLPGVVNVSATQAQVWFKPNGWTAGYVILHYIRPGLAQQNINMTYNSSTARWEYTVSGLSSGQVLQYAYTYQRDGLQYDTGWSSWTKP